MNDVAEESVADTDGQDVVPPAAAQAPPVPPAVARCPRCHADLMRYGQAARFCPRCGTCRQVPEAAPPAEAAALPASPETTETTTETTPETTTETTTEPDPVEAAPPTVVPAPPLPVLSITEHTTAWMELRSAAPAGPVPRGDDNHSLMLLGYANAMFRLGYRYETGLGNNRNPDEAIRCYFKAAKLGNAAALARLAPQCAAPPSVPAAPADPPPAPAGPR
jgi:uncharacterized Zn finger protein (UPF0148 family)